MNRTEDRVEVFSEATRATNSAGCFGVGGDSVQATRACVRKAAKMRAVGSIQAPSKRLQVLFELRAALDTNQDRAHSRIVQNPTQGNAGNTASGALAEPVQRAQEMLLLRAPLVREIGASHASVVGRKLRPERALAGQQTAREARVGKHACFVGEAPCENAILNLPGEQVVLCLQRIDPVRPMCTLHLLQ